ncbi:RidA family protein [Shewanella sp. VB17]|uniref:RidA family protein n=1 Tax=Shewanella sp. VB17 TaxID=2739432 RepID=UPI001563288E|nr:RidA family protein [Shewanella sp. VB17]NRD73193.1 RidA family protein [Shewanella sp. VB17]
MSASLKRNPVITDLYESESALEWAIINNGILYTAQIPISLSGDVVEGGIKAQAKQTMDNLVHTLNAAGVNSDAVLQVIIYVTDRCYLAEFNQIYNQYFTSPYPNRAVMVVAGLAREEMLVEIVVYAAVDK